MMADKPATDGNEPVVTDPKGTATPPQGEPAATTGTGDENVTLKKTDYAEL